MLSNRSARTLVAVGAVFLLSCGTDGPTAGDPDPDACGGSTCDGGDVADADDTGSSDPVDRPDEGLDSDADPDADPDQDTGGSSDGDTGPGPDADDGDTLGPIPAGAISDYIPCDDDLDCPNRSTRGSYGSCVTRIPLNRADGATTSVAVADLFGDFGASGVCSATCTNDTSACDDLWIRDGRGSEVSFTCQVVYRGEAPYPAGRTDFPFDSELVVDDLARGTVFGSICRPPIALAQEVIPEFCAPCESDAECGAGACRAVGLGGPAEDLGVLGACLTPCEGETTCPLGFVCEELDTRRLCVPIEDTCTGCLDADGDGRGDGRCGIDGSVTQTDCDDGNPEAYYSTTSPYHPFPEVCGASDYNCNGLSDDDEQIGADSFPVEHCTACFDRCEGALPEASYGCRTRDGDPACVAVCTDPEAFADCDGVAENGCEVAVSNPEYLVHPDDDGDGAGDPAPELAVFLCDGGDPPEGYVRNTADCDDDPETGGTVYGAHGDEPAAPELCDGLDNDCRPETADASGDDRHVAGTLCLEDTDEGLSCGLWGCGGTRGWVCSPHPTLGDACDTGLLGACAAGTRQCAEDGSLRCVGAAPAETDALFDGLDANCDGYDGDLSRLVFVSPGGRTSGATGTREDPFPTIGAGIEAAYSGAKDVVVAGGTFLSHSSTRLRPGVNVYGGAMDRDAANPELSFAFPEDRTDPESWTALERTTTTGNGTYHAIAFWGNGLTEGQRLSGFSIRFTTSGVTAPGAGPVGIYIYDSPTFYLSDVAINTTGGTAWSSDSSPATGGEHGINGNPGYDGSWTAGGDRRLIYATLRGYGGGGGSAGSGGTFGDTAPTSGETGGIHCVGPGGAGGAAGVNGTGIYPDRYGGDGGAGAGGNSGPGGGAGTALVRSGRELVAASGAAGGSGCVGNGGGGGGGGGDARNPLSGNWDGGGGGGGGGGTGGWNAGGGAGGRSGGSSIALVIYGATVVAERVTARVGNAGNGQAGGVGGNGGAGASGGLGRGRAGDGGRGGGGGAGSGGGGGAGGHSACVVYDGLSLAPTLDGCAYGNGGSGAGGGGGGAGGSPNGSNGSSGSSGATGQRGPFLDLF